MTMIAARRALVLTFFAALFACAPEEGPAPLGASSTEKQPFTSVEATLLDFEFDGELVSGSIWSIDSVIEDQMLYTIGQLNGSRGVGRLDRLEVTVNERRALPDGTTRVSYHAKLPVAWGSKSNLPTSYEFILPRRVDSTGQSAFTEKYKATCVDFGAHDVDAGSMWYYYRPRQSGCQLAGEDVVRFSATLSLSDENTNGKYPEYHKVWEDQTLTVVAIFGKYEDGATTADDAGIAAYNSFVSRVRRDISGITTEPADLPSAPGVANPDIVLRASLPEGRSLRVHALLVDNVRTAGAAFDRRYESLSTEADLIAYNGHAGLGSNIRALARKGRFRAGKYQIFFMNGCDTFAYVDGAMAETRSRLNSDDPTGTKYMEIITNGMPSYFNQNAGNDMALINGLLRVSAPMSYQAIFRGIDNDQVVLVTGEEDNVYVPGYDPGGGGGSWSGLDGSGTAAKDEERRFQTPELPAGTYRFDLSGTNDADLYVRVGAAPSTSAYDCRPYEGSSSESCTVTLTARAVIHVMVRGYAASSEFVLRGSQVGGGGGGGGDWTGLSDSGTVVKNQELRFETPSLPSGRYLFKMTGTGDADLYVRIGSAPTTSAYNCRPYGSDSNETCEITLSAASTIHVMIRGYAASSTYALAGSRQ
ncbi:MAG: PPC domain-containing protein [Deltaproteobacteria bacterium]|nr:PPC domain-containing protein [Deltaproteobacteria bacterium]